MIELHDWTTPNGHRITIFLADALAPGGNAESRALPFGRRAATPQGQS